VIHKKTSRTAKKNPPPAPIPSKVTLSAPPMPVAAAMVEPRRPSAPAPLLPHERVRRLAEARRQALAEWRGADMAPAEAAWRDAAKSTGDILPTVLQRLNLEQRLAESQILQVWDRVLDRTITLHAKPVGLRKGTLFITVDSNVWLSELVRYRYREILEKIQLSVGADKVERLSMRVG
jgi:predicted nucleic acid-binding Zn ribbon protein